VVGELAAEGKAEEPEESPAELWDYLGDFWEALGLPERPLWGVAGDGQRTKAEKVRLSALPIGVAATAAGLIGFLVWLGAWLNEHWGIYAVLPQAVLVLAAAWGAATERRRRWEERRSQGLRVTLPQLDSVDHREFESVVRDLMRRDGFTAEQVGGGGDDACDVRGVDSDGRIWVVQCKHRRDGWAGKATGVDVLQQVNGTAKPVHGAEVAVVVTNGRFSKPAAEWGARHGIHRWADERQPLWDVLGDVRRPRRLPGRARRPRSSNGTNQAGAQFKGTRRRR